MELFRPSHTFVDAVINHPSVRPTVEQGLFRLSSFDIVNDRANEIVADSGGLALFLYLGNGAYEGHIFRLEGSRGANALAFGKLALQRLFGRPGVYQMHSAVPVQLPAARAYCRRLGLKPVGRDLFNEYFSTETSQWAG